MTSEEFLLQAETSLSPDRFVLLIHDSEGADAADGGFTTQGPYTGAEVVLAAEKLRANFAADNAFQDGSITIRIVVCDEA